MHVGTQHLTNNEDWERYKALPQPGVYHVSWAVDNIRQVAKDLMANGNRLRGETGVTQSPRGYQAANINVEDSHGLWFQMSEGNAK